MGIALQLLFTGLGIGSIYALVALGFVLIYRATNVVNFAQGDFAMLGAFSMVVLCIDLELPIALCSNTDAIRPQFSTALGARLLH